MGFSDNSEKYKVYFIDIETSRVLDEMTVEATDESEAEYIAEAYFNYEQFEDVDFECEVKLLSDAIEE